jgi:hypothetical protein
VFVTIIFNAHYCIIVYAFLRWMTYESMYEQEAYCNMLVKYREELARPIDEAMEFLKRVEAQLDSISGAAAGGSAARLPLAGKNLLQLHFISRVRTVTACFLLPHICTRLTSLGE